MAALTASDIVTVLAFTAFSVSNTYTQAEANARFVQNTGDFSAGKNKIINGDLYWNQRSFSSTTSDSQYFADRWRTYLGAGTATFTTPTIAWGSFAGQNSNKVVRITSSSSSNDLGIVTRIENVNTLANQTVTLSFWIRSSGSTFGTDFAALEQYFGSGGSSIVQVYGLSNVSFGSSWTRVSATYSLASIAGKTIGEGNYLQVRIDPVQTLPNGEWIEITHVQLEAGSIATAFQTSTGTIQGELAECQRYYVRYVCESGAPYAIFAPSGLTNLTNAAICFTPVPVELRSYPSSVEYGGTLIIDAINGATATVTGITVQDRSNKKIVSINYTASGGGLTAGVFTTVRANNSSTAYLGISAEL
jgi:hypothetical protein